MCPEQNKLICNTNIRAIIHDDRERKRTRQKEKRDTQAVHAIENELCVRVNALCMLLYTLLLLSSGIVVKRKEDVVVDLVSMRMVRHSIELLVSMLL